MILFKTALFAMLSISSRMDKYTVIHTIEYYITMKKNKDLICATTHINLTKVMLSKRRYK